MFLVINKPKVVTILIGFQNIILLKVNHNIHTHEKYISNHFSLDRSPKKSPSQRKSRQANNDANGTSGTGAASSENDE